MNQIKVWCLKSFLKLSLVSALLFGCAAKNDLDDALAEYHELYDAGEYGAARDAIRRAISLDAASPQLRVLEGDVSYASGDFVAAEVAYRRAIDLGEASDALTLKIGGSLLKQRRYSDVVDEIDSRCNDLSEPEALRCDALVLRASLNIANFDKSVLFSDSLSLLRSWETVRGVSVPQELKELGQEHDIVEAAIQHFGCRTNSANAGLVKTDSDSGRRVLRVGPDRQVKTLAQAAKHAQKGDVVEVDAGLYEGDVSVWRQDEITLRGIGGRVHLKANGESAQNKGTLVIVGNDYVVENFEFSGAVSTHDNGAGIRMHGDDLIVRDSYFHDNQNGILTAQRPESEIIVENSEFARNGYGDGLTHNIYVGHAKRFTLRGSYSHHARVGHQVKSRATENWIVGNRLMDEDDGNSSFIIDLPDGGKAFIAGNVLQQGLESENRIFISFGAERPFGAELNIVNNSFYSRQLNGTILRNATDVEALVANNIFGGAPTRILDGPGRLVSNVAGAKHGMNAPREYDFRLSEESYAIDFGTELAELGLESKLPLYEYKHPLGFRVRQQVWKIDVGAIEFCGY